MEKINNGLYMSKATYITGGNISDSNTSAFHDFEVRKAEDDSLLETVHFQQGPVKEAGLNGIQHEDLIVMVITRLQQFQSGQFATRENACAITKLEEALMWMNKRTQDREARNVEGRDVV